MKFTLAVCLIVFTLPALAQRPDTSGSAPLFEKMMSGINAKHVKWVQSTAETVNRQKQEEKDVTAHATQYATLGSLSGQDIEALAFLVLMQAAKSAQEDLKAIMAQVKAINEKKKAVRDALALLQKKDTVIMRQQYDSLRSLLTANPDLRASKTKTVKRAELNRLVSDLKNRMDALNKQEQEEQLRMQMAMDRMNRMMSAISNLLKKISDTASTITQNLK